MASANPMSSRRVARKKGKQLVHCFLTRIEFLFMTSNEEAILFCFTRPFFLIIYFQRIWTNFFWKYFYNLSRSSQRGNETLHAWLEIKKISWWRVVLNCACRRPNLAKNVISIFEFLYDVYFCIDKTGLFIEQIYKVTKQWQSWENILWKLCAQQNNKQSVSIKQP